MMASPFEVLGLRAWADPDEIRKAYRALARQCHPDMIQDPEKKRAAQEQMIRLNLAYEEALRLASPRKSAPYIQEICKEDAVILAEKLLARGEAPGALRQLMRADGRDAAWYFTQGRVLMAMEQYDAAHQSFREAVKRDPENNDYRAGALDAALALKKEKTLAGKVSRMFKNLTQRNKE